MGVKTNLSLTKINDLLKGFALKFINIEKTNQGISDTVYILTSNQNQKYILKLYENSNKNKVLEEIKLLEKINTLKVSKPIFYIENFHKPLVLYTYIEGKSPNTANIVYLKEIARFLKTLHSVDYKELEFNIHCFDIKVLFAQLLKINRLESNVKNEFEKRLKYLTNIDLKTNISIIHGDIFPDNTNFVKEKLSGVFDFSTACLANSYIDLAIVINSWCFNKNNSLNLLLARSFLAEYSNNITLSMIKEYILYINLFYALKRYINISKNYYDERVGYKEYLRKFDIILEIKKL